MSRGAGTAGERKRGPKRFLFGDLTSQAVEGGGAVPARLISGRIPNNSNWGPCSTSTAAPVSGDATGEAFRAADAMVAT